MLCVVCRAAPAAEGEDVCGASCEAMLDDELPMPGVLVDDSAPRIAGPIVIVPAPSDACGGTGMIGNLPCEGCRACS